MGDKTGISWTDATWNPVRGCSRVSEGCRHCYAEIQAARIVRMAKGRPSPYDGLVREVMIKRDGLNIRNEKRWTGKVVLDAKTLALPLRWSKARRVFVNSMSDLFHESLTNEQIAAVFGVMAAAPQHTFQCLTKRPARMREWFEWVMDRGEYRALRRCGDAAEAAGAPVYVNRKKDGRSPWNDAHAVWPLANCWLGVSVENQAAADERIPELLRTPAAVRFLSCEPLLGQVDLRLFDGGPLTPRHRLLHWCIAGCESGRNARSCSVEWLRSLRDQCEAASVPFFLKQAVAVPAAIPAPDDADASTVTTCTTSGARWIDVVVDGSGSKRKAGGVIELPYLDGVQHAEMPEVGHG